MSSKRRRLDPTVRKVEILNAAISVTLEGNYTSMRRVDVANNAGCSEANVTRYFGTMGQLKGQLLRHALKNDIYKITAQGILHNDPYIKKSTTITERQYILSRVT